MTAKRLYIIIAFLLFGMVCVITKQWHALIVVLMLGCFWAAIEWLDQ